LMNQFLGRLHIEGFSPEERNLRCRPNLGV